ncbi:MAG: HlyD family secretion protein [Alphaproteobacteria bacterium]|nr:HlyD family secretion protein [Alphaproteobacteria bacterium]
MLKTPTSSILNLSNYRRPILAIASFFFFYLIYCFYGWLYTQSTDDAYIESDITFISPEVTGIVEEVVLHDNQVVQKGDVLVKINQDSYRATFDAAKNILESSEIDVSIIDSEIDLANLAIKKLDNDLSLADSNLQNAKKEYLRITALAEDKFSSKKILDDTLLAQKKAESEHDQILIGLKSAQTNLLILESKKKSALRKVASLKNQLEIAKYNLDNTIIRAPIEGVITSNSARVGSYVRPGYLMFAIVPQQGLYVKANFKETQISQFKNDMKAHVYIDALGSKKINAKIRNLYPATGSKFSLIPTDNATGNFTKIVQRIPVILDLEIPDQIRKQIATGMSCSVHIRIDQ